MTRAHLFVLLPLLSFGSTVARADAPARVGVWAYEEASALRPRLVAELRVRGYATTELRDPGALENLDAAVWLSDSPAHARICSLAGTPRCEEITDPDSSVLLIRIVEAVRAELAAHELATPAAPPPPQASDAEEPHPIAAVLPTPPAPATNESPFTLALAPALDLPLRGLTSSLHVGVHVEWQAVEALAFEVGASTRIVPASVSDEAGTADVNTSIAWLAASLRAFGQPRSSSMLVSLGIGLGNASINAQATAPFVDRTASEWFAYAFTRLVLRIPVTTRVSFDLGAELGAALPAPVVVFADREVAHVHQPRVSLTAGVAFQL